MWGDLTQRDLWPGGEGERGHSVSSGSEHGGWSEMKASGIDTWVGLSSSNTHRSGIDRRRGTPAWDQEDRGPGLFLPSQASYIQGNPCPKHMSVAHTRDHLAALSGAADTWESES